MNAPVTANARRFENYVRWSTYAVIMVVPLLYAMAAASSTKRVSIWATLGMATLVCVYTVLAVRLTREGIESWCEPKRPAFSRSIPLLVVALVLIVLTEPWIGRRTPWPLTVLVVFAVTAMTLAVRLTWSKMLWLAAGLAIPIVAVALLTPEDAPTRFGVVIGGWFYSMMIVLSGWTMVWMLRVLYELQDAQADRARLAVAEERVRISRDLHDVFGRTLATIAVKSQLAEQLALRERSADAAKEMAEIRNLAENAGTEVRRVVRGETNTVLAQELEGARALLDSAGITTSIMGEDAELTPSQSEALGWVVREAVTNILRHSQATQASIALDTSDGVATLTVTNDGVRRQDPKHRGSGIIAMDERLAGLGGGLLAECSGGWFTVTGRVPTTPNKEIEGAER